MTKCIAVLLFLVGCAPQLDYFGNTIELQEDVISLTKMRKDESEKDKFYLTFIEIYNANSTQLLKKKRNLDRYLGLIMKYYGYTEKEILEQRDSNILQPRYYVTVKFY